MYPRVRALLPDLEDVLESYEEHHVADLLVMELVAHVPEGRAVRGQGHRPHRERDAPIEEEEQEWFPKVREA